MRFFVALLLALVLLSGSAWAEFTRSYPVIASTAQPQPASQVPMSFDPAPMADVVVAPTAVDLYDIPDLLTFGFGYFDVFRNSPRDIAYDFRAEYRFGVSLLPMLSDFFQSWHQTFQVHPMIGIEATSDKALYGNAGFVFDLFLTDNIILSPAIVVGLFHRGDGKRLGSPVEFRSTMELAYRFENQARFSVSLGHISNAGLTNHNPGVEIAVANFHVPVDWIFSE